jgi:hypothetical protein
LPTSYSRVPINKRAADTRIATYRNFVIIYAVARLTQQGFRPTRNREQEAQESACSIVTEALKRVGVHMDESNVEKIWGGRSQLPESLRKYTDGKTRFPTGFVL